MQICEGENEMTNVRRDCKLLCFLSSSLEDSIILRTLNNERDTNGNLTECSLDHILDKSVHDIIVLGISIDVFVSNIEHHLNQLKILELVEVKDGIRKSYKLTSEGERIYSKIDYPFKHVISVAEER